MKIMVVGCGTMGCGIAEALMCANHEVILRDISGELIERGVMSIVNSFEKKVSKEKLKEEEKNEILKRLSATINLKEALDCEIVIEAIDENIDTKKKLFKELDYICKKKTILVTNTSSLLITDLSMSTNRPEKVIGMNFFNTTLTMNVVEVIDGELTSKETHDKILNLVIELNEHLVSVMSH